MDPTEIALRRTYDFVRGNLRPHSRILEVGCGKGELAQRLQQDRHQLLALDVSEEAVRQARDRGVAAQRCDFVDFPASESFDAVLDLETSLIGQNRIKAIGIRLVAAR